MNKKRARHQTRTFGNSGSGAEVLWLTSSKSVQFLYGAVGNSVEQIR